MTDPLVHAAGGTHAWRVTGHTAGHGGGFVSESAQVVLELWLSDEYRSVPFDPANARILAEHLTTGAARAEGTE